MSANKFKFTRQLPMAHTVAAVLAVTLSAWALPGLAQTVDEITELKRKELLTDLRSKSNAGGANAGSGSGSVVMRPLVSAATAPAAIKLPAPDLGVVAISGVNSALLSAVIQEGTSARNVRVYSGDITPSGWVVERITPSSVTFTRKLPESAQKVALSGESAPKSRVAKPMRGESPENKPKTILEPQVERVTVGLGASTERRVAVPLPVPTNSYLNTVGAPMGVPAVIPTAR